MMLDSGQIVALLKDIYLSWLDSLDKQVLRRKVIVKANLDQPCIMRYIHYHQRPKQYYFSLQQYINKLGFENYLGVKLQGTGGEFYILKLYPLLNKSGFLDEVYTLWKILKRGS